MTYFILKRLNMEMSEIHFARFHFAVQHEQSTTKSTLIRFVLMYYMKERSLNDLKSLIQINFNFNTFCINYSSSYKLIQLNLKVIS